jgi:signal peptidase II
MSPARPRRPLAALLLSALIIGLDQLTKFAATQLLEYGVVHPICPGLNFTLVHNTGAAFSFLASASGWQRWVFAGLAVIASIYIVALLRTESGASPLYRSGLVLVLGGAVGNLIDRVYAGYVVDFIQVYYRHWYWPAFNVADSAITVGAACLIYATVFGSRAAAAPGGTDRV